MLAHSEGRLLTVEEVAAELRVSPQTVYRRIAAGELEAVQLGGGPKAPIRVRVGAVARFLAAGRPHETAPEPMGDGSFGDDADPAERGAPEGAPDGEAPAPAGKH